MSRNEMEDLFGDMLSKAVSGDGLEREHRHDQRIRQSLSLQCYGGKTTQGCPGVRVTPLYLAFARQALSSDSVCKMSLPFGLNKSPASSNSLH